MALYKLRDNNKGVLNLAADGETERLVRLDPKVTYNTDDEEDAEIIRARPGLFREIVTVEQATASPGEKRGAKR